MLPEELQTNATAAALDSALGGSITGGKYDRGELTLEIEAGQIVRACRGLKNEQQFIRLSSLTAVDFYPSEPRFEVIYHLHSPARNERLRLKCRVVGEQPEIDSV